MAILGTVVSCACATRCTPVLAGGSATSAEADSSETSYWNDFFIKLVLIFTLIQQLSESENLKKD